MLGFLPSLLLVNVLDLQWSRVLVPLLAGLLIGLAQWTVLRNYLEESHHWILAGGTSWAKISPFLSVVENLLQIKSDE